MGTKASLAIFIALVITSTWASEKKLHNFGKGDDGAYPNGALIQDADGNLYGVTDAGGAHNSGTVFELTPNGSGGWTEKVLHHFDPQTNDGSGAAGNLVLDGSGNLYGTTAVGGDCGFGTVFEMSPDGSGGWTEKVIYSFCQTDGATPDGLLLDAVGNVYGTTQYGGSYNDCFGNTCGVVYELSPDGHGGWRYTRLHNFGAGLDGWSPDGPLIVDAAGNLYGTTEYGGDYGQGTVFEVSPSGHGGWMEKKLHNFFLGDDGSGPNNPLIFDAQGYLYGTTIGGGDYFRGTVFVMSPNSDGGWFEKKLHNFGPDTDGSYSFGGVIFDPAGNLYGTTSGGGDYDMGTVFKLTPQPGGQWIEQKLHNFSQNNGDGNQPLENLIIDSGGNLYGVTSSGGDYGGGTVFEVVP
jgi:uncharacterized repeat protein (TIGR03803 family)